MALTVAQAFTSARAYLKVSSTYASAEEVRLANTVNSTIVQYYPWHWLVAAATNISITQGAQDFTMAAGDQNTVSKIVQAYLSTINHELMIATDSGLPINTTQGRPYAIALLSPTQVRVYPAANAAYTLIWRKLSRPTVLTANSQNFDIPDAFTNTAKLGMIWQLLDYADDTRADSFYEKFLQSLEAHKLQEKVTANRVRINR